MFHAATLQVWQTTFCIMMEDQVGTFVTDGNASHVGQGLFWGSEEATFCLVALNQG